MPTTECPKLPNADEYLVEYKYSVKNGEYWLDTTATYQKCNDVNYLMCPDEVDYEERLCIADFKLSVVQKDPSSVAVRFDVVRRIAQQYEQLH